MTENTDSYSATSTTWPRPVLRRCFQRHQRADDAIQCGQRVADRDAGARRRAIGRAGDVAQSAHRLADDAEARAFAIRAGLPVAGNADHDHAGIDGGEGFVGEAPVLERAGAEVLDHDVRAFHQRARDRLAVRLPQVDGDRSLVARLHVPPQRRAVLHVAPIAQRVAGAGRLELDDVGAELGQDLGAERACDQRAQFHDRQARERARGRRSVGHQALRTIICSSAATIGVANCHALALDQRLREVGQHLVQVAQIFRLLQTHHQSVAAKPQVLVDRVAQRLLGVEEVLDFFGAAFDGFGLRLGRRPRAEQPRDQAGALQVLECGSVGMERPAAGEDLRHRVFAVDQDQQPAHVDREPQLAFGEFLGAQFGLDVDFVQIHLLLALPVVCCVSTCRCAHRASYRRRAERWPWPGMCGATAGAKGCCARGPHDAAPRSVFVK